MGDKDVPTKKVELRAVYEIDQNEFLGEEVEERELILLFMEWLPLHDLKIEILSVSDSTHRQGPQVED